MRIDDSVANVDLFRSSKEIAATRKTTKIASGTRKMKIDSPGSRRGFFQNGEKTKKARVTDTAATIWKISPYIKRRREQVPVGRQRAYAKTNSKGAAHTHSQMIGNSNQLLSWPITKREPAADV